MIEATYTVEEKDYGALGRYLARHDRTCRRTRWLWVFFIVASSLIAAFFWPVISGGSAFVRVFTLLGGTAFGLAIAVFYYRAYPDFVAGNMRRVYRRESPAFVFGSRKISIGDQGIVVSSEHGRGEYGWSIIQRVAETQTHIFVHLGPLTIIGIPKRTLQGASPEEIVEAFQPHVTVEDHRAG